MHFGMLIADILSDGQIVHVTMSHINILSTVFLPVTVTLPFLSDKNTSVSAQVEIVLRPSEV